VIALDGVIVEISPGDRSGINTLTVPTAFVFMAGDLEWASKKAIEQAMAVLRRGAVAPKILAEKLPEFFDAASTPTESESTVRAPSAMPRFAFASVGRSVSSAEQKPPKPSVAKALPQGSATAAETRGEGSTESERGNEARSSP
jgi:hypothetical protein